MLTLVGIGPLAWTLCWRVATGEPALGALAQPWAAPAVALHGSGGAGRELMTSGAVAGAAVLLAILAIFAPRRPPPFGDARFAHRAELRRQGLLSPTGIILGRATGMPPAYLRAGGDHHLLLAAPTRSGKGVGIVTPNLLSWPGSAVVLDIKNENFEATSGFRAASGQAVFRFAPSDPSGETHRYNPLDAVRRDRRHRVGDLQAIAHLLTPEGSGEQRMWNQEARALFVGIALYILDTPGLKLTFGQVARILQADVDLGEALTAAAKARGHELDPAYHNIVASFSHKAFKERSGVKSTLTASLELWHDPAVDAATAASDFSFADLRRVPTTIYVSVALGELERIAFLLNIVFQQLVGMLSRAVPDDAEPVPVLILVDEFAALGRMDAIIDRMPFLAGFNVRLVLVVQGLSQLDRLYGATGRELILQNAGLQLFFAPNDDATAHYISHRLGTRTVLVASRSRSTTSFGSAGHISRTQSATGRPLMTPDEVRRLPRSDAIMFVESGPPVRARKIRSYRDPRFVARLRPPVSVGPVDLSPPQLFRFPMTPAPSPATRPSIGREATERPATEGRASPPRRRRARVDDPFAQLDFDRLIESEEDGSA